ncbi:MAG TPA: helix-turn-helix transcriptional regulator [Acetobacteraceae bacterium]|jgi:DNA-binding CsgD family transcriptional regulator|nr:helix-turn-helix transcriptional regulator [Acetobacteraceae bacterium]
MLSLEAFSRLTATIHESALTAGGWGTIVNAITSEIGGTIGGFVMDDRRSGVTIAISTGDPEAARTYQQYYGQIDPIVPALATFPRGTVVHGSMIMPLAEIHRTEFYNDWVKPQRVHECVGTSLSIGQTYSVFLLGTSRGQRLEGNLDAFSRLLPHLVPHLQVAVRITQLVGAATDERDLWHGLLDRLERPVCLLASDGRVVHVNAAGERLLRERDGVRIVRGFLEASMLRETLAIRRIVGKAAADDLPSGGSCVVTRPSGRGRIVLTATPVPLEHRSETDGRFAVAVLFAAPSAASPAKQKLLAEIYELTPTEARLAQVIATGVGVKEAARALEISPSTARTHLLRIFQKTGVSRQAELAHVVTELAAL